MLGEFPQHTEIRRWYANAASAHRDTHVHIRQSFGEVEAFGSISKTLHGAGNHFDVVLVGSQASARWTFQNPDLIRWGTGASERTEVRREAAPPARLAPFHGLGWLEGYSRIVGEIVEEIQGRRPAQAPTLKEHIEVVRELLVAAENEENSRSLSD
jgi:predicted dehydrogenase